MRPRVVIVDYHKGSLSSVARGLTRAGADAVISDDPAVIRSAEALVLPGVGSFYDAISFMAESGEAEAVRAAVLAGAPFLGICLGQQLLFERGDEGVPDSAPRCAAVDGAGSNLQPGDVFEAGGKRWVRGLGLLRGSCVRMDGTRLKVPHVGWDQVHPTAAGAASPLLAGFPEGANMYFTHSYAVTDEDPTDVAARTHYTRSFPSMVMHGTIYGCQFHPEKSSGRGLDILRNFVDIAQGARDGEGRGPDGCDRNDCGDGSATRAPSCAESCVVSDVAASSGALVPPSAERPVEVIRP